MKIRWEPDEKKPLRLVAHPCQPTDDEYVEFLSEQAMIEVSKWCNQNDCGIRISFDTFKFKNKQQISMFLLRWS